MKTNPFILGVGTVVKYNFNSNRSGVVVGGAEKYTSSFTINTQSASKFGFAIQSSVRKKLKLNNRY